MFLRSDEVSLAVIFKQDLLLGSSAESVTATDAHESGKEEDVDDSVVCFRRRSDTTLAVLVFTQLAFDVGISLSVNFVL